MPPIQDIPDPDQSRSKVPKIAVVAVHGVSDQQRCESAQAMANLLLNFEAKISSPSPEQESSTQTERRSYYKSFEAKRLSLPVDPLKSVIYEAPSRRSTPRWMEWLDERGSRLRHQLEREVQQKHRRVTPCSDTELEQREHAFACDFLDHYRPNDLQAEVYETIRLEACFDPDSPRERDVHIYEMYWADLSRLGTGFVQIFSEFYQLLFHVSSLGRHTIDLAFLEYKTPWWKNFSNLQGWAGRLLSLPIPILNLYLLVTVFLGLPGFIPENIAPLVMQLVISLCIFAIIGYALWKKPARSTGKWIALLTMLIVLLLIVGAWLVPILQQWNLVYRLLSFFWGVLLSFLIGWLIKQYSLRRPGASQVALGLGLIIAPLAIGFLLASEDSHSGITTASFRTVEVIYFFLAISWMIFETLFIAVVISGLFVPKPKVTSHSDLRSKVSAERAKRAVWTAQLSLWIPAILFICATNSLWAALTNVGRSLLPEGFIYHSLCLGIQATGPCETKPGIDFLKDLVLSGSLYFGAILLLVTVALFFVIWAFLPSIWSELFPPQWEDRDETQEDRTNASVRLGVWLTDGFQLLYPLLSILAYLFALLTALNLVRVGFKLLQLISGSPRPLGNASPLMSQGNQLSFVGIVGGLGTALDSVFEMLQSFSDQGVIVFAALLTASATSLLVFGRQLNNFSRGIRSILDVILDVDNYLRLHPKHDNPRARIYARYVSLLRYLCEWRDPQDNDRGYDALVIVAHSQGTVITADLLRFLKHEYDECQQQESSQDCDNKFPQFDAVLQRLFSDHPVSDPPDANRSNLPVTFFSMGSPLAQLYGFGFPHLYHWTFPSSPAKPPVSSLGLVQWLNTFRSGDYIGRYLWRGHDVVNDRDNLTSLFHLDTNKAANGEWQEFCLGAGAHTHYWDITAPRVAEQLHSLINAVTPSR